MNTKALLTAIALLAPITAIAAPPPAPYEPKFWKDTPDQAKVLAATFIGGKGNEWLVSGGFLPDGSIILAGNIAGPLFDLADVKTIGTDLPAPPEAKRVPEIEHTKTGDQPKVDKEGKPIFEKPSWRHAGVTGFLVHCSPDLKKILSVHRLPWTSAALTSAAVAKDGSIYIAGRATDNITNLGGQIEELSVAPEVARKDGKCDHAFIAKLSPSADRVEWVRHAKGQCDAPQLSVDENSIHFLAQQAYFFNPAGKLSKSTVIPGGVKKTTSISPIDGSIAVGGEHHWPTGREPWRCPTLNIHNSDCSLKYQLYDWPGPYVGLDNSRLVSDSAIRFLTHDHQGNILFQAWSDGGNSVMTAQPADMRTSVTLPGLGINAAGAGVLSAAYLVRLDHNDFHVTAWTLWLAFGPTGKPNSVFIDNMAEAEDSSVCIAGRSASYLWQTHNKLSDAPASGEYVAVLRPDLTGVRFCSIIPGTGGAEVTHERAGWGIVTSKQRALFVGSATKEEDAQQPATPTVNALQPNYAGGWTDGYAVLLDLSTEDAPTPDASNVPTTPGPTSASFERSAAGKGKHTAPTPPDATTFLFKPDIPKWVTVDAEFRDRSAKFWPSFLYGKSVEGTAKVENAQLTATASISCTSACQSKGDQSLRLLGELFKSEEAPALQFKLDSLGKLQTIELTSADAKGKPQKRTVDYYDAKGTLELAGQKIPVTPKVTVAFGKAQGIYRGPNKVDPAVDSLQLNAWMTLKGSDLGLKSPATNTEIDIRIGMSGIAPPPDPK